MDTVVLETARSTFLVNSCHLVTPGSDEAQDVAASTNGDWDIDRSSPFVTWIAGDFVESDNPNSNKQFWTAGDLELAEYTIKYAPLNMIHKFREPVGFYAATKKIAFNREESERAFEIDLANPVGVNYVWREQADAEWLDVEDMHALVELLRAEGIEVEFVSVDTEEAKVPSGGNAPYKIMKLGSKFQVVNNAGEVKATFKTVKAAEAYQAALYANVPGAAKRAAKIKWTGSAKLRGDKPMAGKHVSSKAKPYEKASGNSLKISALSGLWSHLFPFENAQVQKANDDATLFYSMECRGSHLVCAGDNGCGETFDYGKPETHCSHLMERSSIRHIVNPVFRGGALIIPPTRPGWKQAYASVISDSVMEEASKYAEQTEAQYRTLAENGVDISTSAWEQVMAMVVASRNT